MPDITMCEGKDCPLKDKCYRATAKPGMRQSYFVGNPSKVVNGKFECDYFMGDPADYLLEEMKSIMKSEKKS